MGAIHFHTSAKLNTGIEEIFLELTQRMMQSAQEQEILKASEMSRSNSLRRNIVIVDEDETAAKPTRSCCGSSSS